MKIFEGMQLFCATLALVFSMVILTQPPSLSTAAASELASVFGGQGGSCYESTQSTTCSVMSTGSPTCNSAPCVSVTVTCYDPDTFSYYDLTAWQCYASYTTYASNIPYQTCQDLGMMATAGNTGSVNAAAVKCGAVYYCGSSGNCVP